MKRNYLNFTMFLTPRYVPIMKILMLMPEEELNHHASTLIVKVASQMKSRRLEERQLAREILCEMAAILGIILRNFLFKNCKQL